MSFINYSGNKAEKKTRNKIMESCQELGSLIIVCAITYMCSTNSVFVCVEENKNVPPGYSGHMPMDWTSTA